VSFYNNIQLGITRLTRTDGGSFGLVSIDLDALNPWNSAPPLDVSRAVVVRFIGTRPDGTTVDQYFMTDTVFPSMQTFTFSSSFDNVIRVEWVQGNNSLNQDAPHQFDNIVLIPNAQPGDPPGATATPTFSPPEGAYSAPGYVTVSCATPYAWIHYTTNGVDPTESDAEIASGGTVLVDRSLTLKARAWSLGSVPGSGVEPIPSSVASAEYTLEVATPTFSPGGGTYNSTFQTVTVSCATPDVTIHYTTSGNAIR